MTQNLYLTIGGVTKTATLVSNSSTEALVAQLQKGDITRIGKLDNMTQADIKTWVNAGGGNVSVTLSISEPTGISQIKTDETKSQAYTLTGTLAQAGTTGIIIQNGKKIIR